MGQNAVWLRKGGRRSDAVTWTRVAASSDKSADGYPSGYTWNARGPVGDFLLDSSVSRVWDGSRLK